MKKPILMLVMLIGLTTNAQSVLTQDQLIETAPTFYTEFVNNQRITSVTDANCTLVIENVDGVPEIRVTAFNENSTSIYFYDIDLNLVSIRNSAKADGFKKTVNYKL